MPDSPKKQCYRLSDGCLFYNGCQFACQQRADLSARFCCSQPYIGSRSSYMIDNSPYTCPQFRIAMLHFFVASKVARYKAFRSARSLGKTLLWRFSLRYVAFGYFSDHFSVILSRLARPCSSLGAL